MSERGEAVDRLLQAWRGEVQAGAVYRVLAGRQRDPRRADLIRRMSEAEANHRRRIERRLQELGVEPPDPNRVRPARWLLLQARFAPLERVLARMESAEVDEISDRYLRSTGDAGTDELLADIRKEESEHQRNIGALQSGVDKRARGADGAISPVQSRLDRILTRETWHQTGAGWLSGAIYGANDGLAAVFGIVAGVSGATGGSHFVLLAGLSGAVASALSMATGAFLAERSETEVAAANLAHERREIEEHPDEEREELSLFYQLKGLSKQQADMIANALAQNPDALLRALASEELSGGAGGRDPVQAALAAGISTAVGAFIPCLPYFFLTGTAAIIVAFAISLLAHFLVGAAKSLFTLRSWWAAGLEMTVAGALVGGGTYVVGLTFPHL